MSHPVVASLGKVLRRPSVRWLLAPAGCWLVLFFFIPLCVVLVISFASRGTYGGIEWTFNLDNYTRLGDPLYWRIYWRSAWLAGLTTLLCLILGFPLAAFMIRVSPRWQALLLMLVMIPFWTNFLVRMYAWIFILRTEGLLNTVLIQAGILKQPLEILYSETAVIIGLVYGYLPFMVLPLYIALERLDRSVLEAAQDLYAGSAAVFRHVTLPLTKPGIIAGSVLVFIPSFGAFITPDLLGGSRTMMIGNLVQHEFLVVRDWPFGAAVSFGVMGLILAVLGVSGKTLARGHAW